MLAAFVLYTALAAGLPYVVAAAVAVVGMGVVGYVFQPPAVYPLRNRSFLAFIIATIGFSIFARNLALLVWGTKSAQGAFVLRRPSAPHLRRSAGARASLHHCCDHDPVGRAVTCLFFHTDLGRRHAGPRHRTRRSPSSWAFGRNG